MEKPVFKKYGLFLWAQSLVLGAMVPLARACVDIVYSRLNTFCDILPGRFCNVCIRGDFFL